MDFQLLNKYLRGEASEPEVSELYQWIDAAPGNRKEVIEYKKVWAITALGNENESQTWKILFDHRINKRSYLKPYLQFIRYAAIFLLVFVSGISLGYFGLRLAKEKLVYNKSTSINSPLGQMTNVELPDGTKVMLNSGSSITYNGNFSIGERVISLSGEAYFDVYKDNEHPFIIQTSLLNLKVHGTSFNIEAYPEENMVNSTLIEGSLGVMNKDNKELLLLVPGENAHFDAVTKKLSVSHVKTEIYTSWKDGLITFRNEKLKDIARKIERWYNVKIVIKNQSLGEEAYFGTIMKNKPIDQILDVLKLTSSLKYKIITNPTKPSIIYWF